MYYWHGVRVTKRLVEAPDSFSTEEISAIQNSEFTRALAERMGWEAFLAKIGAHVIRRATITSSGEDGQTCSLAYELLHSDVDFGGVSPKWLRMQSPQLKDGTQPWYIEPVDPELATVEAARVWRTRRSDGTWPDAEDCDSLEPDWAVRHGDLIFHECEKPAILSTLKPLPGPSLVSGAITGHSHTLVGGPFELWDLGDGRKLIHRLGDELAVDHEEHKRSVLPEWSIQSVARQFDAEHGWMNVED
jgi:hypothetical protein